MLPSRSCNGISNDLLALADIGKKPPLKISGPMQWSSMVARRTTWNFGQLYKGCRLTPPETTDWQQFDYDRLSRCVSTCECLCLILLGVLLVSWICDLLCSVTLEYFWLLCLQIIFSSSFSICKQMYFYWPFYKVFVFSIYMVSKLSSSLR